MYDFEGNEIGAGYPFLYDVLSDSITEGYVMSQTDCIFATSIYLNENGTVREAGHAVNLVGYATYRDNSTGNTLKFLTNF